MTRKVHTDLRKLPANQLSRADLCLGVALLRSGRHREARKVLRTITGEWAAIAGAELALLASKPDVALKLLVENKPKGDMDPLYVAPVLAAFDRLGTPEAKSFGAAALRTLGSVDTRILVLSARIHGYTSGIHSSIFLSAGAGPIIEFMSYTLDDISRGREEFSPKKVAPQLRAFVKIALSRDPQSPFLHVLAGLVAEDPQRAGKEFQQARALDPTIKLPSEWEELLETLHGDEAPRLAALLR
jgi:hypothetical protein